MTLHRRLSLSLNQDSLFFTKKTNTRKKYGKQKHSREDTIFDSGSIFFSKAHVQWAQLFPKSHKPTQKGRPCDFPSPTFICHSPAGYGNRKVSPRILRMTDGRIIPGATQKKNTGKYSTGGGLSTAKKQETKERGAMVC